ncbi:DUF1885 family protein [Salinibacillus xinjiangensis]|uniref:DUF1885 family protein n=1 Tax=Salinibacillus xinjiangensis TaxID=1229268 RepID=UPI001890EF6C|nr:DUF1885 family protein [Salinibacillus xinjiangensis]
MSSSTYIYVNPKQTITLADVKEYLLYYQDITAKTGDQLNWDYSSHAFPYTIQEKETDEGNYLLLYGQLDRYNALLIGVHEEDGYIQITLPDTAKHGDKSKANELAKFLAKKTKGKIKLFNGRMM